MTETIEKTPSPEPHGTGEIVALQDWSEQKYGQAFSISACHDLLNVLRTVTQSPKDCNETLRPLYEAVNTRSHVKISPSQASRILSRLTLAPQSNLRPLELLDRADYEAIEWVTSNLTAIRRDDGSLHYNLTQIVRAFQAGKERS